MFRSSSNNTKKDINRRMCIWTWVKMKVTNLNGEKCLSLHSEEKQQTERGKNKTKNNK